MKDYLEGMLVQYIYAATLIEDEEIHKYCEDNDMLLDILYAITSKYRMSIDMMDDIDMLLRRYIGISIYYTQPVAFHFDIINVRDDMCTVQSSSVRECLYEQAKLLDKILKEL